jgi:hypothetical protein
MGVARNSSIWPPLGSPEWMRARQALACSKVAAARSQWSSRSSDKLACSAAAKDKLAREVEREPRSDARVRSVAANSGKPQTPEARRVRLQVTTEIANAWRAPTQTQRGPCSLRTMCKILLSFSYTQSPGLLRVGDSARRSVYSDLKF